MQSGLTDTHCHLNSTDYDADLDLVMSRARAAGLSHILVPGVDLESSRRALKLATDVPEIYAAVGIHPHHAAGWNDGSEHDLRTLVSSERVVAIGEIGLDYYRDLSPREDQRRAFKAQIELALELELPIIVHQRESMGEILDTLLQYELQTPGDLEDRRGVLHAFSGDAESASIALAKGFYLGVAGPITFRKADPLRTVMIQVPKERVLIETDSPYMTPEPHRGKRNEPANVRHIANRLAALFEVEPDDLVHITANNANSIFRWCNESSDSNIS